MTALSIGVTWRIASDACDRAGREGSQQSVKRDSKGQHTLNECEESRNCPYDGQDAPWEPHCRAMMVGREGNPQAARK